MLRAETKGTGVRVCCVHPGATWSPSWRGSGVNAAAPSEGAAGRDAAVSELVAARQRHLRRIAHALCGDWHRADDLLQTARRARAVA